MMNFSRKKKERRERYSPSDLKSKHIVVGAIFLVVIILTAMTTPCFAAENVISWTEDELTFMEDHPVIRLGVDPGFVPFEFIDDGGEYKGITADYLDLLSEKTGIQFEVVQGLT